MNLSSQVLIDTFVSKEFLGINLPKELDKVSQATQEILTHLNTAPDNSLQAKIEWLERVYQKLKHIQTVVGAGRTKWKKVVVHFLETPEEKHLNHLVKLVKKHQRIEQIKQNRLWKSESNLEHIIQILARGILKCAQFLGFWKQASLPLTPSEWISKFKHQNKKLKDNLDLRLRHIYFQVADNQRIKSNLEGMDSLVRWQFFKQNISEFMRLPLDRRAASQLDHVKRQITFALNIERKLGAIRGARKFLTHGTVERKRERMRIRLADLSYELQMKVKELKPGAFFILPGGYRDLNRDDAENDGHAVLYHIGRQLNGKIGFGVINTGEGADFLAKEEVHSEYIWSDIEESSLCSSFWISLLEPMIDPGKSDFQMKEIYGLLTGKLVNGEIERIQKGQYGGLQTNGVCAHQSAYNWLQRELDPDLFSALDFHSFQSIPTKLAKAYTASSVELDKFFGIWEGKEVKGRPFVEVLQTLTASRMREKQQHLQRQINKLNTAVQRLSERVESDESHELKRWSDRKIQIQTRLEEFNLLALSELKSGLAGLNALKEGDDSADELANKRVINQVSCAILEFCLKSGQQFQLKQEQQTIASTPENTELQSLTAKKSEIQHRLNELSIQIEMTRNTAEDEIPLFEINELELVRDAPLSSRIKRIYFLKGRYHRLQEELQEVKSEMDLALLSKEELQERRFLLQQAGKT